MHGSSTGGANALTINGSTAMSPAASGTAKVNIETNGLILSCRKYAANFFAAIGRLPEPHQKYERQPA